jgi:hypothetical protein
VYPRDSILRLFGGEDFGVFLTAGVVVGVEVGVGAAVRQQVPDDDEDRVGDGDRRFGSGLLTHPPFEPTQPGTESAAGVVGGPGRLDQDGAQVGVAVAGLAAVVFAG